MGRISGVEENVGMRGANGHHEGCGCRDDPTSAPAQDERRSGGDNGNEDGGKRRPEAAWRAMGLSGLVGDGFG